MYKRQDNGLELLYGKNIKQDGISEEVDFSDVVTRIVPKSYNGYMMSGSMPWVDSPIIKNYPTVKTRTMTFEDVKMRADEMCIRDRKVAKRLKLENSGDIITSGAVSGARNPESQEAKRHAERYYGLVRSMTTDVAKIAKVRCV